MRMSSLGGPSSPRSRLSLLMAAGSRRGALSRRCCPEEGIEGCYHPFEGRLGWPVHAVDRQIGLGIDGMALGYQFGELLARLCNLKQRPVVAPRDPAHQQIEIGTKPDRYGALPDQGSGAAIHEC